jgi:hypothetical protein
MSKEKKKKIRERETEGKTEKAWERRCPCPGLEAGGI